MTERNLPVRFGLLVFAGLLAVLALVGVTHTPSAQAAGAALNQPSSNCSGGASATVAFQWGQLSGATAQYLDLSVQDGSFALDTFAGTAVNGSSFTWAGLQSNSVHWWRINTNTPSGWQPSATGMFVPCGNPAPLTVNATCADANNANVDFFWAPMAGPNGAQFIDIAQDGNFPAGAFQGAGPIGSGVSSYKWSNVKSNTLFYYRINQRQNDGTWKASVVKTFTARCGAAGSAVAATAANYNSSLYGSNDRFVMTSRSIDAPVNMRDIGPDGTMGDPAGKDDVVRYNFGMFPGMGGTPGQGGTVVVAAHVDYHPHFYGPFWYIRDAQPGEVIDYYKDGKKFSYQVDWVRKLTPGTDWNSLLTSSNPESMIAITCDGVFNSATHEYDLRTVVHAVRIA